MKPPAPGSGPGSNAPQIIDVRQIDRIVLAAMGLRSAERDPSLHKQVGLFQGSSDGKIKALKVNIAEDVFGRLAYEAVIAAKNSQKYAASVLLSLGGGIIGYFTPNHTEAVEVRAGRVMARLAKRRMRILSTGSQAEEREDFVAAEVLKRWVDENKDVRFAYLDAKIRQSYMTGGNALRPWVPAVVLPAVVAPPSVKPPETLPSVATSPAQATLVPVPASPAPENPPGNTMTTQPDSPTPPTPSDPAAVPAAVPPAPNAGAAAETSPVTPVEVAAVAAPVPAVKRASAWKFLEVPEEEPDRHSYTQALVGHDRTPGGLPIVAARVRGKKHKHEGTNGDDAFDIGFVGNWTILAVSDGAGSCRFSRVGSQAACDAAVDVLARRLADVPLTTLETSDTVRDPATYRFANEALNKASQGLHEAMQAAYKAIENETQKRLTAEYDKILGRHIEVKDLSCTLLLAIHIPVVCQGKKYDWVMGCQVGDGMIAAVSEAGSLVLLATADTGAFSGETDFITSKNKMEPAVLWSKTQAGLINMRALMAMTDGVADDYFPNNPGMLRLFGDLCLNGVVQFEPSGDAAEGAAASAPAPDAISTLSERLTGEQTSEEVRIYSVEAYAKAMGKSVDQVMKEPHEKLAQNAGLAKFAESGSQRLLLWLDSYQVRGSFDDRALAMIYSTEAGRDVQ